MKSQLALLSYLLLLWMQTAFVSCDGPTRQTSNVEIIEQADGIKLSCKSPYKFKDESKGSELSLPFNDDNSGEHTCVADKDSPTEKIEQIYIKFRSCDNCVELDQGSIAGIIVGNIVATIIVGVAVYLIASVSRTGSSGPPKKKSSDRVLLVPNEGGSRANEHYQPLRPRQGQTYDVLNKR